MKKILRQNLNYIVIAAVSLLFLGSDPVEFAGEKAFFHGFLIPKPIIRIGLGVNLSQIQISASDGMKIYEVKENYKLIAEDVDEVFVKGHKEKLSEKFLIQVAQTNDIEEAEHIAHELRTVISHKVFVTDDTEDRIEGLYQVIVGDFITRGDALGFVSKLNAIGVKDTWILQEEVTEDESKPLWILVNDELKTLSENTVLYFIPSTEQSYLSFKGRDYRGIFILRASHMGVVLVNILNLEDYLKSVVPSELSPYNFNEIEAHKAQAVAARTYATKNMRLNDDLGFDLCDTPKSQFYKGMNTEHPLSSRAVHETHGEVALFRGKLIDALYTSTCGGMTENVEDIFQGPALPYLRSTECVYENQKEWTLESQNVILPVYINGNNINLEIASLLSLGVISQEMDPLYYGEEISYEEAALWIKNAMPVLGKKTQSLMTEPVPINYLTFANLVIDAFGWQEKIDNLMLKSEKTFILKDVGEWNGEESSRLAYLIQEGIFPDFASVDEMEATLTRGEVVHYLWRIIQGHPDVTHHGTFRELKDGNVRLEEDSEEQDLELSPSCFLIKRHNENSAFLSHVNLLGGEEIAWIEKGNRIRLLMILYPPYSNVLDRSSALHSWQVRISKKDLEKRINEYYPVGQIEELTVQKRGDSKRVVALSIKGDATQVVVKGLRVRRVLGLREMLFVIDREYDEKGDLSHYVFNGRGWGHGVGLCQVGAYGMALAGAGYKEILKKYYHGIKIKQIF
ncbi:MAG: SpoIID/LytB domain-containing protein [Candidatus Aminicenantes bacterium]|jgi:stage II sporulation protein D